MLETLNSTVDCLSKTDKKSNVELMKNKLNLSKNLNREQKIRNSSGKTETKIYLKRTSNVRTYRRNNFGELKNVVQPTILDSLLNSGWQDPKS